MGRGRLALLICTVLLVSCNDGGGGAEPGAPTTEGDAEVSVEPDVVTIHPVLGESAPPCEPIGAELVLQLDDHIVGTVCFTLGAAEVDASMVLDAGLTVHAPDVFGVAVELDDVGARALDAMAARAYPGRRLAIVVGGRLVAAPSVHAPEFGGSVVISELTTDEAVALVTALGGDPTLPEPEPRDPDVERASELCRALRPDALVVASEPTNAGRIIELATVLGEEPPATWRSVPADTFVARCGFSTPGPPRTTICPGGDVALLDRSERWLVDEGGRSTPDVGEPRGPIDPCS